MASTSTLEIYGCVIATKTELPYRFQLFKKPILNNCLLIKSALIGNNTKDSDYLNLMEGISPPKAEAMGIRNAGFI